MINNENCEWIFRFLQILGDDLIMKKVLLIAAIAITINIPSLGNSIFPAAIGFSGTVVDTNVNIRMSPNLNANIVDTVSTSDVKILGQNNGWYQIVFAEDVAWVSSTYVDTDYAEYIPNTFTKGEQIINYGLNFIGTPYVWGGNSLTRGVDCSGFTKGVYGAFDIEISRISYQQANDGDYVEKSDLETGDLVFFDTSGINNGNISHVGIYMDKGKFIHSDGTKGVMVSSLSSPYYSQNYVKSVRVIH